jgi:class 3 adenylate cyclase
MRFETQLEFAFSPELVWTCLGKTDWLNRSLGLPPVKYQIEARPEGGSWVMAQARFPFGNLRWREWPFEWLEPKFYRVRRVFDGGPFTETRAGIEARSEPGGRTIAVAYAELFPRGTVGKFLAKSLLGPKLMRDMGQAMAHAKEFMRGESRVVFPNLPVQPVIETTLRVGLGKLEKSQPADLVQKLESFLRQAPDVEMTHIRPFAIARKWNEDQWKVLGLFLHATRCGLLNFRWEVLCPNCRSSRETPASSLAQLKRTSHCDVCQIKFDAEFDKSVELKFEINRAVRPCEERTYCLAGPGGKPHVVCQTWLEPAEERLCPVPDLTHPLRLFSPQVREPLTLRAGDDLALDSTAIISCEPAGFQVRPGPPGELPRMARMANPNPFPVLLSWQQTEWSGDILTAARATNCQEFRELFAREVISPNEQVTVGSQVILFTDLRGSTALYHGLGDGPAYALVRNHFSVLTGAISAHHGTVVKTIGDAVMAAFSRVDEALAAVQEGYQQLSASQPGSPNPLLLKCSLHVGPCLAVNANDKLDFFGTTVNLAARMVECCQGGDLTVSDEFYLRPETVRFIQQGGHDPQPEEIRLHGFDAPRRVWRIKMQ